jgi:hypothetical protein
MGFPLFADRVAACGRLASVARCRGQVSEENLGFPLNRYRPSGLPNGSPSLQASAAPVGSAQTLRYISGSALGRLCR